MEPVTLRQDIEPTIEPDGTFPGAHGIYFALSREPEPAWQLEFERQWQQVPHGGKRRMTVVGDQLRVTIGPRDHLAEIIALAYDLVAKTNGAVGK